MVKADKLIERMGGGGCLGALLGGTAAAVGTIWGGYELGTAINDAIQNTSTVGRGALDFIVMAFMAGPALSIGIYGGAITGTLVTPLVGYGVDKTKDLGSYVSETYQNWKNKEPKNK